MPRLLTTLIAAVALLAGAASAHAATLPTFPLSPSAGGPSTKFFALVPAPLMRRAGKKDVYLGVSYKGRHRCDPYVLPQLGGTGNSKHSTARVLMDPRAMFVSPGPQWGPSRKTWCKGTYIVTLLAFKEDAQSPRLAQSRFVVR